MTRPPVRPGTPAAHPQAARTQPHRAGDNTATTGSPGPGHQSGSPVGGRRDRLRYPGPGRFFSALLSGHPISRASRAEMMQTALSGPSQDGLGIFATSLPCGRFWGHGGDILTTGRSLMRAVTALASPSFPNAVLSGTRRMSLSCSARPRRAMPASGGTVVIAYCCSAARMAGDFLTRSFTGAVTLTEDQPGEASRSLSRNMSTSRASRRAVVAIYPLPGTG